ncbi:hypothetical protein [Arsenophonus nasoniae]|uniref:Uncharacterized protein n=1 Tax=Arsenophonus nasoniae TaxID=638 RepID=A0AA95GJ93_9GAMM|nr:hypothetical protein [Arsenophonus nasoniae]WGM00048.1 hypothetical protein QE210_09020 [Arsenophonus nasoniae]
MQKKEAKIYDRMENKLNAENLTYRLRGQLKLIEKLLRNSLKSDQTTININEIKICNHCHQGNEIKCDEDDYKSIIKIEKNGNY